MKKIILILLLIKISTLYSHPVVLNLNLEKFMGRWYIIALIPNWIEENNINSFDDYVLNKDGTINITYKTVKDGKERTIKQKATIVDKKIPGRWEVQFTKPWIPFYRAPYEVILLNEDYKYMVVGYPDNQFGWIMSRTKTLDNNTYKQILDILNKDFGYDSNTFKKVIHND
tara:strand:+ start:5597 stop:6109 length:513 start_codon:yes stop_codon:yes gene_type:complete